MLTQKLGGTEVKKMRIAGTKRLLVILTLIVSTTPVGSRSGGGTIYIDLVPIDSGDCD